MADKDIYKPLFAFAHAYSDALSSLNKRTLETLNTKEMKKTLLSMTTAINKAMPMDSTISTMKEAVKFITRSYSELFGTYDLGYTISESLRPVLAEIQVNTLLQISQAKQTVMMHELAKCFANAQYGGLVDALNQTLSAAIIVAPDIAFIKTSELVSTLNPELIYPRGLSKSLNILSKVTANDIAANEELTYKTENNRFISTNGEIDSMGLNVICSGKKIFNASSDELFTEIELIDFTSFLSRTPMLAFQVETGKKIYELLRELFNKGAKSIGFDKDTYYHCRSHKMDVQPFTYDQMLKAPNGLPWAGRYNQVGRSNYYFSDTRGGAEAEIKKHKTNDDVLQTVKLKPIKPIKMLDLSGTLSRGVTFLRYLRFSLSDTTDKMPREYLIPCYVSDCCKVIGFEGIKYYGSKDYCNYVVWNDGYFMYDGMC